MLFLGSGVRLFNFGPSINVSRSTLTSVSSSILVAVLSVPSRLSLEEGFAMSGLGSAVLGNVVSMV